jgi:hypothetical protein
MHDEKESGDAWFGVRGGDEAWYSGADFIWDGGLSSAVAIEWNEVFPK